MNVVNALPLQSEQAQMSSSMEVATKLRRLLDLKSVHVIPAALSRWEGWAARKPDPKAPPFSTTLGHLAAPYVAYELANALVSHAIQPVKPGERKRPFRIGVASGSTVRGLVDAFQLPDGIIESGILSNIEIEIAPLVIGPLPETVSSAGFIADTLSGRFANLSCKFKEIANKTPEQDGFRITMLPEVREERDKSPYDTKKWTTPMKESKMFFDWIITGIGANAYGQWKAHVEHRFGKEAPECLSRSVGDICSRMFDASGSEVVEKDGDKFVAMSFDWLKYLAGRQDLTGRRVIAVVGGEEKFQAVKTLARNCISRLRPNTSRLFNCLVTDEIMARRLFRDLEGELAVELAQAYAGPERRGSVAES